MRLYLLAALVLTLGVGVTGTRGLPTQKHTNNLHVSSEYCTTDLLHQQALLADTTYARQHQQLETAFYRAFAQRENKSLPPPYTLPVVFHIIHENGSADLSDAAILQSLDDLNQAFANTGYYDQGQGTNTQIQFCLAQRTPDNMPTSGITRMVSNLTEVNSPEDDIPLKDLIRWDPTQYINIWVVREICGLGLGCGVAGYAYLPGSHGGVHDGIVVEAGWLGTNPADAGVLIHEMGHYLGLYHTFQGGCANDDCLMDGDRVCDTPPDQSQAAVPCSGTVNTCTTDTNSGFASDQNDMFNNYMDYGFWSCYNAFTPGQRDRMHFFIEGARSSLLESPACLEPCPNPVVVSFSGGDITVEIGTTVTFDNLSAEADTYEWRIDGAAIGTTANISYDFNTLGTFTITLIAHADDDRCISQRSSQAITVTCPVEASFTGPFTGVVPGDAVTFTNTSTNATSVEWRINDNQVGTTTDLTYTFNTPGLFTICLTAGNGLCAEEICRNLLVQNPPDNCDSLFFVSQIGNAQINEVAPALVAIPGGGYYVGAVAEGHLVIMRLTELGDVVWSRTIQTTEDIDGLFDLQLDDEQKLLLTGHYQKALSSTILTERPYAMRYDPQTDQVLWWTSLMNEVSVGTSLVEEGNTEQLIWTMYEIGTSQGATRILRLNKQDGSIDPSLNQRYSSVGNDLAFNSVYRNGTLYSVGQFSTGPTTLDHRASVAAFDMQSGNVVYSRLLPEEDAAHRSGIGKDLYIDEDGWVAAYDALYTTGSNTAKYLYCAKGQHDGSLSWAKRYDILGSGSEGIISLEKVEDGYILLGSTRQNEFGEFLCKIDEEGNMLWAKAYHNIVDNGTFKFGHARLITSATAIQFIGAQEQSLTTTASNLVFIKTDLTGALEGACNPVTTLEVTTLDMPLTSEDIALTISPGSEVTGTENIQMTDHPVVVDKLCYASGPCPEEDCGDTFAYYYAGFSDARFNTVISDGTDYYVGGSLGENGLVAKLDIQGQAIWVQELFPNVENTLIRDLKLDSDGMLMGLGRSYDAGSNTALSFAFRINPLNGSILWIKSYDRPNASTNLTGILEPTPGGDYYLMGETNAGPPNGCDAAIFTCDRNTGAQTNIQRHYQLGSCETILAGLAENNTIYVTGRYNFSGGGVNRFRPAITSLDIDANPVWSRLYLQNVNTDARLYGTDILKEDNSFLIAIYGDENGTAAVTNRIFLVRTNLAGGAMFGKRIIMPANTYALDLATLSDGYLLLAHSTDLNEQYLLKFDNAGNLVWARTFSDFILTSSAGTKILVEDDHIIMIGAYAGAAEFPVFLRLGLDGLPTDACLPVGSPDVTVENIVSPYDGFHQLGVYDQSFVEANLSGAPSQLEILDLSCPLECEEEEICDNGMDDDGDGLIDCDDPDVANDCCCQESPSLNLGADTTLCADLNLLLEVGVDFIDYQWSDGSVGQELVVTAPGVYWVMVTDSCDQVLTDTIQLSLRDVPVLDLGPDVTVCDNAVVPLDAGPGFAHYEWVDGSTERFYTAYDAGAFWVIATDSCGGIQTDTVQVMIDPATEIDLGPDTTICANDTLLFSVSGYQNYQWFPRELVDCDDCAEVRFSTHVDTTLIVVAELSLGCISTDTIHVAIGQGIGDFTAAVLCAGDTLYFGDEVITSPGTYLDNSLINACQPPDTLVVDVLAAPMTEESIQICGGDSVLIFGQYESQADSYIRTYTNAQMCDSTHTVILEVNPTYQSEEIITICPGETTLIFGQEESEAGFYLSEHTTQAGCDSNFIVQLVVTDLMLEVQATNPSCSDQATGAATALPSNGTTPYMYLWSTGATTQSINQLAEGTYGVTVTDGEGCVLEDSVVINAVQISDLMVDILPVSCAGDGDGAILISDLGSDFSYSLDGINFQSNPSFFDLPAGTYTLTARQDDGCEIVQTITIDDGPLIFIRLTPEQEVLLGTAVTLTPTTNASPNFPINWQSSDGQSCMDCSTWTITPTTTVQVTAEVVDSNGCTAQATTTLLIDRTRLFYVPNAFSPNDDGVNELFTVFAGPAVARVLELRIFDRWGEAVFANENFPPNDLQEGWDGRFRGSDMNTGTFVYYLRLELVNGEIIEHAADLILLR